jgi:Carbohydrate-binding module 48 (Isoamylase N-terminal domain)
MKVWPGSPYPLGATWDGSGVNFALFSENATGVELCLFDGENRTVRRSESGWPNKPTKYGMFIYPKRGQDSFMAIVCMDRITRPRVTGLTRPNFSWIPMPSPLPDPYGGAMRSSVIP